MTLRLDPIRRKIIQKSKLLQEGVSFQSKNRFVYWSMIVGKRLSPNPISAHGHRHKKLEAASVYTCLKSRTQSCKDCLRISSGKSATFIITLQTVTGLATTII